MNIAQSRRFYVMAEPEVLIEEIRSWGAEIRFRTVQLTPERLVLTRGSKLWALVTFNIRKIPTTLSIHLTGHSPSCIDAFITVSTGFSYATSRDPERIGFELNSLEDRLWALPQQPQTESSDGAESKSWCARHPDRGATISCARCGDFLCKSCRAVEEHCHDCHRRLRPGLKDGS